jgi:flagellar M-ring protein FliF
MAINFNNIVDQFMAWPLTRKLSLLFVLALCVAIVTGVYMWTERVDYQVLFSNVSQEDSGQVIGKLKEMKIPYRVEGNAISVPSDKVYELRLELASQGIPQGGGVGFEIFDKTQFGVTEFVQRLNYVRALQGELSRTIKQLSEVSSARVHIAIPERSIFTGKDDRPSASVVLKLRPGSKLSQGQVGGILHLVASSVEGLPAQNITIIDNMGNLLSKPSDGDMVADAKQLEYQKNVDREYESKLQSMLEGIVGKGKAIVRVSTKIDFTKVERTEEKFDPETVAVRTENRSSEKSTAATQGGIPGVASNQPGQPPAAAGGGGGGSQKQTENINYEVSRVVSKISEARGVVKSISVAVLVDGAAAREQAAGQKAAFTPRSEQEMKKFDELVKAAIGFDKNRGDQVIVENVPFETAVFDEQAAEKTDYLRYVFSALKYLIPLAVVILLFMFVIKPLLATLSAPVPYRPVSIPAGAPGMPHATMPQAAVPEDLTREKALGIVNANPQQAANVVKEWLQE